MGTKKVYNFIPAPETPGYHNIGRFLAIGIILSLVPASVMTYRIIGNAFFEENVVKYIRDELDQKGTEILAHNIDKEHHVLEVVAVGREIKPEIIKRACEHMERYKLEGYTLEVVQGEQSDSVILLSNKLNDITSNHDKSVEMLKTQSAQIADLTRQLDERKRFVKLSGQLRNEIKLLFPSVETLMLSVSDEINVDTVAEPREQIVAVIGLRKDSVMNVGRQEYLNKWLSTRVGEDNVMLVIAPSKK